MMPVSDVPRHVAMIMDGNGRWAQKRLMPRSVGHKAGVARVRELVRYSSKAGVEALTLYAFSTENWKRPEDEVGLLMRLFIEYMKNEMAELNEENVCFRLIGDRSGLPKEVRAAAEDSERETAANTGLKLSICVNYGGRDEILAAASALAAKAAAGGRTDITKEEFEAELMTVGLPDPDLIIRTSGELRLSNFLLWQGAYAELYFTDVLWPDFTEEEYKKALASYAARKRRYGGV